MPELPEVETITNDLRKRLVGWTISNVWSNWPRYFFSSGGLAKAQKVLKNRKILKLERRGKNILFYLSGGYVLAVHLKMTGYFLFAAAANNPSEALTKEGGQYPKHVHMALDLRSDLSRRSDLGIRKLYFSDVRKFGRIIVGKQAEVLARPEIKNLGPDPLEITTREFLQLISRLRGKIKTVLLNQEFLAGVGNIYSDEALYLAQVHPLSRVEKIPHGKLKMLFIKLVSVLDKSIKLRGTTRQDYRDPAGQKGDYFNQRLVYARKGEKCSHRSGGQACSGRIKTAKIGSRTTHFCPQCQKLYQ